MEYNAYTTDTHLAAMNEKLDIEHHITQQVSAHASTLFQNQSSVEQRISDTQKRIRLIEQSRRYGNGDAIRRIRREAGVG